jgi:hypothetical protein
VTQRYANVVTFRDDLIIYQAGYGEWESALEAVGLEGYADVAGAHGVGAPRL